MGTTSRTVVKNAISLCLILSPLIRLSSKILWKIPFYDVFLKCLCSFSNSQFFLFGKPFQRINGPKSKFQFWFRAITQYISIREYYGSSIFIELKDLEWSVAWSMKFFNFPKIHLKLAHNNYLCKYRIWWAVHKKVYSFKSTLINYNAIFVCNVVMSYRFWTWMRCIRCIWWWTRFVRVVLNA